MIFEVKKNMELIVVKVRPSYNDKKMHVLRFLLSNESFSVEFIKSKLYDLFPYGFFKPIIERYMIDYSLSPDSKELVDFCNHDYLAKYLNSEKKIE